MRRPGGALALARAFRPRGLAIGVALLALFLAAAARAEPAHTVDYLYVEANESGGSGGHAAIRFGEHVFHFQWMDGGLLGVSREEFASFRRRYALLENRSIRAVRIAVSDETFDLLSGHFTRRRLIQHQHLQTLDALAADRRLLGTLRAVGRGEPAPPITVEGAGYFAGGPQSAASDGTPALPTMRERIALARGSDFVEARAAEVTKQIETLDPRRVEPPATDLSMERAPPPFYGFAQRYQDAAAAAQALEVIRTAGRLRPDATVGDASMLLSESDRKAVDALRDALADSLVRLAGSHRPDWGRALLVGLARLQALDLSRQSGSWLFLDVFPPDARRVPGRRLTRQPDVLASMLGEAQRDFEVARARILRPRSARDGFPELEFAGLEAAGNRLAEALRTRRDGEDLRLLEGRPAPARQAALTGVAVPRDTEAIDEAFATAAERHDDYAERLQHLYGYRLFTRNCVTEIFQEIDRALAGSAEGGHEASRQRLGGHLPMTGLRFIPVASASAAADVYRVSETVEIPSYRRATLARLSRDESPVWVFLRESNTLTSTLYHGHPADSAFLFFTEDAGLARPLFGAANVLTGVGATVAGVATLPFDRGRTLWAGLKGVVFSIPELFYVSLRKGSFAYVPDVAE